MEATTTQHDSAANPTSGSAQSLASLDLADLRRSGLSDLTIQKMGVVSLSVEEVSDRLGVQSESGGYAIPYQGLADQTGAPYSRVRLRAVSQGQRYSGGAGDDAALYIPLAFEDLNGVDLLVVTEGEKKAAKAVQEGIACVGIQGVWSWADPSVRAVEKHEGLETSEATPAMPELLKLARRFKRVLVLGDSDLLYPNKGQAKAGLTTLANSLRKSGCEAYAQFCPPVRSKGQEGDIAEESVAKQGLDDWLVAAGAGPVKRALPLLHLAGLIRQEGLPDTIVASRFAKSAREALASSPARGWMVFSGTQWVEDKDLNQRLTLVEDFRQQLLSTADAFSGLLRRNLRGWPVTSKDRPKEVSAWAEAVEQAISATIKVCNGLGRLQAVEDALSLAQPKLVVSDDRWDCDPLSLGLRDGIVDLRTGVVRTARPTDYLTRSAGATYNEEAESPLWLAFLERVQPDPEMREALQRIAGYTLTGLTREQAIFIHRGSGANGKSTFIRTILAAMGRYAAVAGPALVDRRSDLREQGYELAHLDGARLATISETEERTTLATGVLKRLAGDEPITARHMYASHFSFVPQCKVHLSTNHLLEMTDTSHGAWRRIHVIQWPETIQEGERDRTLMDRLKAELPGILVWMVRGAKKYLEHGLLLPTTTKVATEEMRAGCDHIQQWLDDNVLVGQSNRTGSSVLYDDYSVWCTTQSCERKSRPAWGRELAEKGYVNRKDSAGYMMWSGLTIRSQVIAGICVSEPAQKCPTELTSLPPRLPGGSRAA
ncbi:phage/plasmid primase, P4 family [Terriglobus sp.]|uniref:phage/plasmid primase, P4 family n=1 Tax=Terriglobus sp. TaxID=1889013 RepID=UPI003B003BAA